jgi:hypothetical protein
VTATPPRPIGECSLTELASTAQLDGESASFTFDVAGCDFVEMAVCCEVKPVRRFVGIGEATGNCTQCGQPMFVSRASANGWISAAKLGPELMERPISDLGGANARWIAVQSGCRAVVFVAEKKGA